MKREIKFIDVGEYKKDLYCAECIWENELCKSLTMDQSLSNECLALNQ